MANFFEAILSVAKTFTDEEPKSPLHVGEVMWVWLVEDAAGQPHPPSSPSSPSFPRK